MTQCLTTLGYQQTADTLQQESGILLLSEPVAKFRAAVLAGEWEAAESFVDALGFATRAGRLAADFMLARQKYLELLEAQRSEDALRCLRCQLAPLEQCRVNEGCDIANLVGGARHALPSNGSASPAAAACDAYSGGAAHACANGAAANGGAADAAAGSGLGTSVRELSGYLMCGAAELRRRTGWEGAHGGSRAALLRELQQLIPPSHLLPEHRLQTLLQQAVLWQSAQCAACPPAAHCADLSLIHI